jgi:SAM-dependent methyltransferase
VTASRRFDSIDYLHAWHTSGKTMWPTIHRDLFQFIYERVKGKTVADLCCSTGLLAQQIHQRIGLDVIGLDGDEKAIAAAQNYGVTIPLFCQKVTVNVLPKLKNSLQDRGVTVIIARRCLPELIGDTGIPAWTFSEWLADSGIQEVFLEGRIPHKSPSNPLHNIDLECKAMDGHYEVVEKRGRLAYLWRRQ